MYALEWVGGRPSNFPDHEHTYTGIWEAMEKLNTLVDESDPDVRLFRVSFIHCR
jgi:hypothetical protein